MLKNRRTTYILIAIAFLMTMSYSSGCGQAKKQPVVIGLLVPLSGNGRGAGALHLRAVESEIKRINDAGGIDGRHLKLEVQDTMGDEAQTLIAIKRLLEINYAYAVLYPYQGGYSQAVPSSFDLAKTPVIIYGAQPRIPKDKLNMWTIIIEDNDKNEGDADIISVSDSNLKSAIKALEEGIKRAGIDKARARRYMAETTAAAGGQ